MGKLYLMKFVTILSLVIAASIFVSAMGSPNRNTSGNTDYKKTDGGKIFYLDRHPVSCGSGAVTSFQLQRSGSNSDNVRYLFTCVFSDAITGGKTEKSTSYNKVGYWQTWAQYLDRHDVSCPTGTVIQYFRQGRDGNKKKLTTTTDVSMLIFSAAKIRPHQKKIWEMKSSILTDIE